MKKILLFSNVLMITIFILKLNSLPPEIPFFYSRRFGEDQLGDLWIIFLLPFFLNLFFFINNFFYKNLFFGNFLVKKIVDYLNLFLIIIIPLIFLRIIFLVT